MKYQITVAIVPTLSEAVIVISVKIFEMRFSSIHLSV